MELILNKNNHLKAL